MKTSLLIFFTATFANFCFVNSYYPTESAEIETPENCISSKKNLSVNSGEFQTYILFTSYVDRCIIRDNHGDHIVEDGTMNQTVFEVKYDKSKSSFIRLENDNCDENPTLIICTADQRKCTRKLFLDYGEEIPLDSCFIKFPSLNIYDLRSHWLWITSVLDDLMSSKIVCDVGAFLKGGTDELNNENSLIFTQADHSYFVDWMDFDIHFVTLSDRQIESMYIIEHNSNDDLVLCAGDVSDMKEVYNFSNLLIPNIEMVIEKLEVQDTVTHYRFRDNLLRTMAFKELKKGKWYAMEIKLKHDSTYYVMHFQFLTEEDIEYLKSLGPDE